MISAGARMRIPMRIRTGVPDLKVLERGVAGVLDVVAFQHKNSSHYVIVITYQ